MAAACPESPGNNCLRRCCSAFHTGNGFLSAAANNFDLRPATASAVPSGRRTTAAADLAPLRTSMDDMNCSGDFIKEVSLGHLSATLFTPTAEGAGGGKQPCGTPGQMHQMWSSVDSSTHNGFLSGPQKPGAKLGDMIHRLEDTQAPQLQLGTHARVPNHQAATSSSQQQLSQQHQDDNLAGGQQERTGGYLGRVASAAARGTSSVSAWGTPAVGGSNASCIARRSANSTSSAAYGAQTLYQQRASSDSIPNQQANNLAKGGGSPFAWASTAQVYGRSSVLHAGSSQPASQQQQQQIQSKPAHVWRDRNGHASDISRNEPATATRQVPHNAQSNDHQTSKPHGILRHATSQKRQSNHHAEGNAHSSATAVAAIGEHSEAAETSGRPCRRVQSARSVGGSGQEIDTTVWDAEIAAQVGNTLAV